MIDDHNLSAMRERFRHLDALNDAENPDHDRERFDRALRVAAWSCAWDVGKLLAEVRVAREETS